MSNLKQVLVVWSIILSLAVLFFIIKFIIKKLRRNIKSLFIVEKDNLSFLEQYTYYDSYSNVDKLRPQYLSKILDIYRSSVQCSSGMVSIETKFNNVYYATFDLDTDDNLVLFRHLFQSSPYVLFASSEGHYWGIVDVPHDNIKEIFYEPMWKNCNDQNYVTFCRDKNTILIRGLYSNDDRKPKLHTTRGTFSKNFQLFIDKLCIYYNKEGLELSVLRYKDPKMLMKFNRRRKLQQLKDLDNE